MTEFKKPNVYQEIKTLFRLFYNQIFINHPPHNQRSGMSFGISELHKQSTDAEKAL